jgi:hypothetical protein
MEISFKIIEGKETVEEQIQALKEDKGIGAWIQKKSKQFEISEDEFADFLVTEMNRQSCKDSYIF